MVKKINHRMIFQQLFPTYSVRIQISLELRNSKEIIKFINNKIAANRSQ